MENIWNVFSRTHIYLNLKQLRKYCIGLYSVKTVLTLVNVSGEMHFQQKKFHKNKIYGKCVFDKIFFQINTIPNIYFKNFYASPK